MVIEFKTEDIAQIASMGFTENSAKRALSATKNSGAEGALNWIFEHMDDPGTSYYATVENEIRD